MERALNSQTLTSALGSHPLLPDPAELRRLLADTEVRLFTQQASIDDQLLDVGWYLQSVASARRDLELYELPRQRLAHQVSGHIFDLALQSADLSEMERLRYTFAAQVGYLGGQLTPNASALEARAPLPSAPYRWSEPGRMSLEAGTLVLALARPALYPLLRARQEQLARLEDGSEAVAGTPYDAFANVIRGVWALTNYLTYGRADALDQARALFAAAVATKAAEADVDSRWVAAHLHRLCNDLGSTSVWAVMPPDLPGAAKAMTLGDPPVLTLWPPQLSFLASDSGGLSPLDPAARRLVLSFPTSAGKTLLAQLLITVQVASGKGDVCVVAPTHSLCREISVGLDKRLRTLGYGLHQESPLGLSPLPRPPEARVSVMTPEKLAAMLRSDAQDLLSRFSMFVIDEAHLVADGSRGWRLEETLSFLHQRTLSTDHRILVLSAALGNQIHIVQWMAPESGDVVHRHENWRAPRRLNAIYTTEPNWDDEEIVPASGRRLARYRIPMRGVIRLSTGAGIARGEFKDDVGTLVLRDTRAGGRKKDTDASTRQRECLVPLINHVSASGSVLVVQGTRVEAQRIATCIADTRAEGSSKLALVDLVRTRLGDGHPLTQLIPRGVAFHHAALPVDIQAEIENAVRSGQIQILAATSTLTEGVNLPFKTVIVGSRGYRDREGYVELIDGADLLNAVGRAGRAGRETEGWVILAEQQDYNSELFDPLHRTGDDLDVCSTLTSEAALADLADLVANAAEAEDAVFARYDKATAGFLSFVWFIAQSVETTQGGVPLDTVTSVVENTLAWHQLEDAQRASLLAAAEASLNSFQAEDPERRARWARSGTSLRTARTLEQLAQEVQNRVTPDLESSDLVSTLDWPCAKTWVGGG